MARNQPQQQRSRELVSAVLIATVDLLRGAGDALSMRKIAERAGVGVASIYDYFQDREQVLAAVVGHVTRTNFEHLHTAFEARADQPLDDALAALLDDVFTTYLDQGLLTRSVVAAIVRFGSAEHVVAERDRFAELLAKRIARDLPAVDVTTILNSTKVVQDMVFGVVLGELHRPPDAHRIQSARLTAKRLLAAELARLQSEQRAAHSA
jgi:AcrR family transcriptional regulator